MKELSNSEVAQVKGGVFGWAINGFLKGWNMGGDLSSYGSNYDHRYLMQPK